MLVLASGSAKALLGPDNACTTPETQDTEMSIFEPDRYAWVLFMELSHPANVMERCADLSKKLGDEGPVLWETWRNIMPGARGTVFRPKGAYPGPWRTNTPDREELARLSGDGNGPLIKTEARVIRIRNVPKNPNRQRSKSSKFGSKIIGGTEILINRNSYLHIREHELYNRDVLNARAKLGVAGSLDLPKETKEVKARWTQITEADKPRYHWTIFRDQEGNEQLWGLTGLHISTKDLPNWFWTTFEHIDNKPGFVNESVDAYACPDKPVGCDSVPEELKGTKWENYRLRGTQVSFVDKLGGKTVLANSQLEEGVEDRSSCITCHAEAAIEKHGRQIQISNAFLGKPRENLLKNVMLMDFMFIFKHASSPTEEE